MKLKGCQIPKRVLFCFFYLQRRVKDDQFGAGGNGIVAAVTPHEVHVYEGVGVLACRGRKSKR